MSKIGSEGIYDARSLGPGKVIILGLQHMFAMFGATVLVPILTGLSVSTTLLWAGLGTLLFHLFSKKKVERALEVLQTVELTQCKLRERSRNKLKKKS